MSRNVCKCGIGLLVADAVGGKMIGAKAQHLFHTVIDRVREPVYLALGVHIDSLHIPGFFICTEGVGNGHRYTA